MEYAPVVIPTLNRAEHLERCLRSLSLNTGAEQTEVYISVDYPPSAKYEEGYHQVCALLKTMDLSAFRKVHLFFQETNLGPIDNEQFLRDQIKDDWAAFIFSEDDNEFSPNFLEYMNQGLERFRHDDNVIAVCGCRDTDWVSDGRNVLFGKLYAAYGIGIWFEKEEREVRAATQVLLPQKVYGPGVMWRLYRKNRCLFYSYLAGFLCSDRGLFWQKDGRVNFCDTVHSIYMHLTDAVVLIPETAKSRTWGNDGSGTNMEKLDVDPRQKWPIDTQTTFWMDDTEGMTYLRRNMAIGDAYMPCSWKTSCHGWLLYAIVLLCGRDRGRALKLVTNLRKWMHRQ